MEEELLNIMEQFRIENKLKSVDISPLEKWKWYRRENELKRSSKQIKTSTKSKGLLVERKGIRIK